MKRLIDIIEYALPVLAMVFVLVALGSHFWPAAPEQAGRDIVDSLREAAKGGVWEALPDTARRAMVKAAIDSLEYAN